MGTVTVLMFAGLAERAGVRRIELESAAGDTVAAVCERLLARIPEIEPFLENLAYAVDEEYAGEDTPVPAGATVALIPPVSGGARPC